MELILHIGYNKTGTTSIQKFCHKNREILLKEFGIYYPNTYGFEAHHIYSCALSKYFPSWVPKELRVSPPDSLFLNIKAELETIKPQKVLMSSEFFISIPHKLNKVVEYLTTDEIKIILYIRRQDKIIESMYTQGVKSFEPNNFPIFLISSIDVDLDFYRYIKTLEDSFRNSVNKEFKIDIRIFFKDMYKDWDIIDDFCNAIGIKKSVFQEREIKENISFYPTSTEALKRLKKRYEVPIEIFEKIIEFLYEYDIKYPSSIKTLMPFEVRKKILEYYKESNEKLFREYFNQENLFVLSKEEEEFYKEQESIPKEEIEREIEEKYKSIIEFIRNEGFIPRTKIFTDQIFGVSELTIEFIKCRLISDWVGGYIDVCNEEKIAGWLLDLKDKEPCFLVKLNEIVVHVGIPSLERVDIKDIYGIDWYAGFSVFWKDVKLPEQILSLPDDAEIEVEVIHEKKGYIIPGNYKKILKKDLIAKIKECEKPKAEIRQILTLGSKKLIYIYQTVTKPASEALFTQTDITDILITYLPDNQDWNFDLYRS